MSSRFGFNFYDTITFSLTSYLFNYLGVFQTPIYGNEKSAVSDTIILFQFYEKERLGLTPKVLVLSSKLWQNEMSIFSNKSIKIAYIIRIDPTPFGMKNSMWQF